MIKNRKHSDLAYDINKTRGLFRLYTNEQYVLKERMKELYGLDSKYDEYTTIRIRSKFVSEFLCDFQETIRNLKKEIKKSQKEYSRNLIKETR